MKKIIIAVFCILALSACKKEQQQTVDSNETTVVDSSKGNDITSKEAPCQVYSGTGTYDKDGKVDYTVCLPNAAQNVVVKQVLFLADKTVFILIDDKYHVALTNPNNESRKLPGLITVPELKNDPTHPTYRVYLYHDDIATPITLAKATQLKRDHQNCLTPDQCGNGVLSFQ